MLCCAQLCSTVFDPMNCSPPGFSVQGISKLKYWSVLPFPLPSDLPDPGIKLVSHVLPELASRFFTMSQLERLTLQFSHLHRVLYKLYSVERLLLGSMQYSIYMSSDVTPANYIYPWWWSSIPSLNISFLVNNISCLDWIISKALGLCHFWFLESSFNAV